MNSRYLLSRIMVAAFCLACIAALIWANSIGYLRDGIYWLLLLAQQIAFAFVYKKLKEEEGLYRAESQENSDYQQRINELKSKLRKAKWYKKYYVEQFNPDKGTKALADSLFKKYLKKKFPYG